jgi:hypothetical protein
MVVLLEHGRRLRHTVQYVPTHVLLIVKLGFLGVNKRGISIKNKKKKKKKEEEEETEATEEEKEEVEKEEIVVEEEYANDEFTKFINHE